MTMARALTLRSILATLAICSLSACKGGDGPSAPEENTPAPSTSTGTIRVSNSTSAAMWFVYFSPCETTDWGVDRLGDDVILSGNSVQWTSVPTGCWDVKAELSDGREAESAFSQTVDQRDPPPALSVRRSKSDP
jgi:hypothetical protein